MNRRSSRTYGFTLMEMMIALLLGAIVVGPLYVVTRGMAQNSDHTRMETEATQRARLGLDGLMRDFGRAGMFASPDAEEDKDRIKLKTGTSLSLGRRALVHLNRLETGNDAVLLTGGFLGDRSYEGNLEEGGVVRFETRNVDECLRQFDPRFAFAAINNKSIKTMDVKISDVFWDGFPNCRIVLDNADRPQNGELSIGSVMIASIQTALYFVESVTTPELEERRDLVRYFIAYDAGGAAVSDCSSVGATSVDDITLPGTPVLSSRQVIAQFVEDFQVWLRPTSVNLGTDPPWTVPHYHTTADLIANSGPGGTFADGFILHEAAYVVPINAAVDPLVNNNDLSCDVLSRPGAGGGTDVGPERIQSAIIRLATRTEHTDQAIDYKDGFGASPGRLVRYNLVPYVVPDAGLTTEKPGSAYKLKTMVVEVPLVNLANRKSMYIQR